MSDVFRCGLENAVAATLMAAVVAVVSPCLRRRPAVAHVLWVLVLLKLVTPPLWSWRVPEWPRAQPVAVSVVVPEIVENPNDSDVEFVVVDGPPVAVAEPKSVAQPRWRLDVALLALWIAGATLAFALALRRAVRFQRLLALADETDESTEQFVTSVATRLGMRRKVRVSLIDATLPPLVWSWGRTPRLVLPRALWKRLDVAKRETIVAHELAHLARGDDRVRWLEQAITALYWWLPTVWWARAALREAEERCCDAWVVWGLPGASRAYAETLIETVDFLGTAATGPVVPASASGFGRVHNLKRRVTMLMQGKTQRRLSARGRLLVLAVAAVLLPTVPTWGQKPPNVAPRSEDAKDILYLEDPNDSKIVIQSPHGDMLNADMFILQSPETDRSEALQARLNEEIARCKKLLAETKDTTGDKKSDESRVRMLQETLELLESARADMGKEGPRAPREAHDARWEELELRVRDSNDPVVRGLWKRIDALNKANRPTPRGGIRKDLIIRRVLPGNPDSDLRIVEVKPPDNLKPAEREKLQAEANEVRQRVLRQRVELQKAQIQLNRDMDRLAELARKLGGSGGVWRSLVTVPKPPADAFVPSPGDVSVRFNLSDPVQSRAPQTSDQEKRIAELEKKLDRLIDSLAKQKDVGDLPPQPRLRRAK